MQVHVFYLKSNVTHADDAFWSEVRQEAVVFDCVEEHRYLRVAADLVDIRWVTHLQVRARVEVDTERDLTSYNDMFSHVHSNYMYHQMLGYSVQGRTSTCTTVRAICVSDNYVTSLRMRERLTELASSRDMLIFSRSLVRSTWMACVMTSMRRFWSSTRSSRPLMLGTSASTLFTETSQQIDA